MSINVMYCLIYRIPNGTTTSFITLYLRYLFLLVLQFISLNVKNIECCKVALWEEVIPWFFFVRLIKFFLYQNELSCVTFQKHLLLNQDPYLFHSIPLTSSICWWRYQANNLRNQYCETKLVANCSTAIHSRLVTAQLQFFEKLQ